LPFNKTSCGVVATYFLARLLDKHANLSELHDLAKSLDGDTETLSLATMKTLLGSIGLQAVPVSTELSAIPKNCRYLIAPIEWRMENAPSQSHFVIATPRGTFVRIISPIERTLTCSSDEFSALWSGDGLLVLEKPIAIGSVVAGQLREWRWLLLAAGIVAIGSVLYLIGNRRAPWRSRGRGSR
jgi:ABC-type bacteriocin/lantibiotic exporter with double-glycine peptidase domain